MEPVIAGHPLHPSLITVPVGLLPASYVLDLLALATDSDTLAEAAYYNMLMGYVGAFPAALTGFLDYRQMKSNDPAHKTASTHGLMNASAIALYTVNLLLRRRNRRSKLGFALSTIGFGGLLVSAYLGGEIAYGRGWRVRNAERFELEWQKEHGVGPFAPSDQPALSTEQEYPPETIKGFREKKSGEAVFKEIQQSGPQSSRPSSPAPAASSNGKSPARESLEPAQATNDLADKAKGRADYSDRPSQAEGDRDTINADLRQQEPPMAMG